MRTVGIDFGTSTTLVAIRDGDGDPRVVQLGATSSWIPSVAALDKSGSLVAGDKALAQPPERRIESAKSLLGQGVEEVEVDGRVIKVSDVVKAILDEAISAAKSKEPDLLSRGTKVFAGCPSLWGLTPRQKLASIYRSVGVEVSEVDLLEEPVAAGVAWINRFGNISASASAGPLLVFDAGGGTLDVAVIDFDRETPSSFFVLASESLQGSGDELDSHLAGHLHEKMGIGTGVDGQLLIAARQLKESLSTVRTSTVPFGSTKKISLTREQIEEILQDELSHLLKTSERTIRSAMLRYTRGAAPSSIRSVPVRELPRACTSVFMVGGTSAIPALQDGVRELFGGADVVLAKEPQTTVAVGLTYAGEIESLNMPRPPLRLVADVTLVSGDQKQFVIGEAFEPTYRADSVARGENFLGISCTIDDNSFGERISEVRFFAEHPSKPKERHDLSGRTWSAPVRFKFYATGDFIIFSGVHRIAGRVRNWPQFGQPIRLQELVPQGWYNSSTEPHRE